MVFIMLITLYSSRVVLRTLGIEDYGIYNIVGGVVVLFSFLNGAMTSATQRYLSYEIEVGEKKTVNEIFSICFIAHIVIALFVLVLGESLGLWLLKNYLNIPSERFDVAIIVYHFTILSFVIGIITVPFSAAIIAYERINIYAFITIVDAFFKLGIALILPFFLSDKLLLYGFLTFCLSQIIFIIYIIMTRWKLHTRISFFWDKDRYRAISSFSGWSILGGFASISVTQGLNVLINIFFGVTVNSSVGIANQVSNAVYSLATNFQTAFKPQLIKYYASQDLDNFLSLIFRSSKISYFLILLVAMPILLTTEDILILWLGVTPPYLVEFCRLIVLCRLIDATSGSLWISVQATGNIKKYQLIVSSILLLTVILSYIALKMGFYPPIVYIVELGINIVLLIFRITYLKKIFNFPVRSFIRKVLVPIFFVTAFAVPLPYIVSLQFIGLLKVLLVFFISLISVLILIYFIGFDTEEKKWLKELKKNQ